MIDSVIQSSSMTGSSSCQWLTTLYREKKEMQRNVKIIPVKLRIMIADFLAVIGHSWALDQRRNGSELFFDKPNRKWDRTAEIMMLNFADSGHPIFRATSALERGEFFSTSGMRGASKTGCAQDLTFKSEADV